MLIGWPAKGDDMDPTHLLLTPNAAGWEADATLRIMQVMGHCSQLCCFQHQEDLQSVQPAFTASNAASMH